MDLKKDNTFETPLMQRSDSMGSVPFPAIWANCPDLWFVRLEALFSLAGVTADNFKYNYVVSHLDRSTVLEVKDILIEPPVENKYATLKAELIHRLPKIEEHRVRQLIKEEKLGDHRPSEFLKHLQTLTGHTSTEDSLIRDLWLCRLPQYLQTIFADQYDLSLEKIAQLADKMLEVAPNIAVCHPTFRNITRRLEELTREIDELKIQRGQI